MIFFCHRFDGWNSQAIQRALQFSLSGRQPARNARIVLTGSIYCSREGLKKRLGNMVGFITVKQFQVKIASALVRKSLKKLTSQPEPECAGHILVFFSVIDSLIGQVIQSAPNEERPPAEIDYTAG